MEFTHEDQWEYQGFVIELNPSGRKWNWDIFTPVSLGETMGDPIASGIADTRSMAVRASQRKIRDIVRGIERG